MLTVPRRTLGVCREFNARVNYGTVEQGLRFSAICLAPESTASYRSLIFKHTPTIIALREDSVDSDLEAFSRDPPHGSVGAILTQVTPFTKCAA